MIGTAKNSAPSRRPALNVVSLWAVIPWTAWCGLTAIWIATLVSMTHGGHYVQWLAAATVIALLYVLALAEGLEIAAADLLDKQPEQLRDDRARKGLLYLQRDPADFFSNRQLFVVTIIAFTTLMTTYPSIYVPFVGSVAQQPLPGLFSFAWTTLTVLWFAQVTPKRLAIINSETFLAQSVFLLPVVRAVGYLGVPRASGQLVTLFEKFTRYSVKRHLQPSASAYYNATGMKAGIAADHVEVTVGVNPDGSGIIRRKSIVCFLHGKHLEHTEANFCSTGLCSTPRLRVLRACIGPQPERLETIAQDLEAIATGANTGTGFRVLENWPHSITIQRDTDHYYGGEWARWTILSGRPLPEAYWRLGGSDESVRSMIVLEYEVEFDVGPGGLALDDHRGASNRVWPEYIDIPTRMLEVKVAPLVPDFDITIQGCDVRALRNNLLVKQETERCSDLAIAAHDGCLSLPYPQQGATYAVSWWQKSGVSRSAPDSEFPTLTLLPGKKSCLTSPRLS
jgi:hypothetical protein